MDAPAVPDKQLGTPSKFSAPPNYNVDNRVIFPFCSKQRDIFQHCSRGMGDTWSRSTVLTSFVRDCVCVASCTQGVVCPQAALLLFQLPQHIPSTSRFICPAGFSSFCDFFFHPKYGGGGPPGSPACPSPRSATGSGQAECMWVSELITLFCRHGSSLLMSVPEGFHLNPAPRVCPIDRTLQPTPLPPFLCTYIPKVKNLTIWDVLTPLSLCGTSHNHSCKPNGVMLSEVNF